MGKLIPALMWVGIILCLFYAYAVQGGGPAGVLTFLALAAVCVGVLIAYQRRERGLASSLPRELGRVWYLVGVSSVAFRWRWRGRRTVVRILRSPTLPARAPDAHTGGGSQVLVYEGSEDHVLDDTVESGVQYHYTIWVQKSDGRWRDPVFVMVAPMDPEAARHIEASYEMAADVPDNERRESLAHYLVPDPRLDPHRTDVEWARLLGPMGPLGIAGKVLGGVLTDAVFAATDGMNVDELQRAGWVEVS